MKLKSRLIALMVSPLLWLQAEVVSSSGEASNKRDYWPTQEWKTAPPAEHGLDTNRLAMAIQQLPKVAPSVRSLLVVRHGRLIVERYFQNWDHKDNSGNVKSVSKSILSALVGIAIEQGYLRSIDQPVMDFFSEYRGLLDDPRKNQITIRHLLTMSAGLDFVENGPISRRWMASKDWHGFTLGSKMVAEPGTEFNYSTALTHLLSGIITRATGTNTLAYAQRTLFEPMGGSIAQWDKDPRGNDWGGSEVHLTPRNMAKFGYLYLNNGQWDGQQIVPESWVRASTQQTNSAHYGFLWWLDRFESLPMYFAQGLGGQYIAVVPDLDVVVVVTCWFDNNLSILSFIKLLLLPCVERFESADSLPLAGEIVHQYYEALGGREQLARLKSLRMSGTVEVPAQNDRGKFEVKKGTAGRITERASLSKNKLGAFGSDGKVAWSAYPNGYRLLSGGELRPWWGEEAGTWADRRSPEQGMQTLALTPFAGRLCYQVQTPGSSGEVFADFFDQETKFLMGSIRAERTSYGWVTVTRLFSEYRQFGDFYFPSKIALHVQGPELVMTRNLVEYNNVSPRSFALPPAIRDILKGKRAGAR